VLTSQALANIIQAAIAKAQESGDLPQFESPQVTVQPPRKAEFGDLATSTCMQMARLAHMAPMNIAGIVVEHLGDNDMIGQVDIAPPGFINFTLSFNWLAQQVEQINAASDAWGQVNLGQKRRTQVEYGSANPTGPLHVGFGRNVILGDGIANVLSAAGYEVHREYYVNDAGTQVEILGTSLYARYLQLLDREAEFPEDGYRGQYIVDWAQQIIDVEGDRYLDVPTAEAQAAIREIGLRKALKAARADCDRLGIYYDNWFSEKSLRESGLFNRVYQMLQDNGYTTERDGATWFTSPDLDADAVIIRSPQVIPDPDKRPTYLASDLAYAWNKLIDRGFERAIYVWGADHLGDVPRVKAGVKALGLPPEKVVLIIYQMVSIKRSGEDVRMSKRAGEFVPLSELLDDVGPDATRFFLLQRSADSQMDFDVDLAKEQSAENPVYYVQYAHARIASVLRTAQERGWTDWSEGNVSLLEHPQEQDLIRKMIQLPEIVTRAAIDLAPHHLCYYAQELASAFHSFYRDCRIVSAEPQDIDITKARLKLACAAKHVLANTLRIIGVDAPERM
jgi:arginyl-tRNA synthetase